MKEETGIRSEIEAFYRILEIVKDERNLERHQYEKEQFGAIEQSKAFAFEEILKVLKPFLAKAQEGLMDFMLVASFKLGVYSCRACAAFYIHLVQA